MAFGLLLLLFFCSGACGLIYQVLWLRLLALVFGVTVYAASTVLAAFMTGLALGSALAGRLLARIRRPLRLFGIAEIGVGVSAVLTPIALDGASAVYRALHHASPDSLWILTTARLVTSSGVLLVPTVLMGLTLPVLSAAPLVRGTAFGPRLSALYAVNTAGAMIGAVLTGFYLIGAIGIQRSFLLAAAINVVVGALAIAMDRRMPIDEPLRQHVPSPGHPPIAGLTADVLRLVAIVVAISGLVALALEILWFRILLQYLAATTYAFTTMLATVLAGIAAGGAIATSLLRRPRDWLGWLAMLQMTTALAVLGSATFLAWSYRAGWSTDGDWQASAAAILPAAMLMGIGLPIALRIAAAPLAGDSPSIVAGRVGRLYSLNVLGAIAGSLLGGFVVLPLLGTRRGIIALAAVYGVSGVLMAMAHARRVRLLTAASVFALLFAVLAIRVPDPFRAAYERRYGRDMREFWRDEGVQTAVSVHASEFRRSLYLDGLPQANDTPELVRLHRIIGHLPMVLHPAPSDVLVIGLGGGATSGALSQHPARVQIVELSESVRRAAPLFAHINYDVLNQPNVRIRVDDGRNFLMLSGERFDVITADIIQPSHAGAGNLYSREYFQLVRSALKERGVALQWIGARPASQYRLIMRTFLDVFPDATLWLDGTLMVGSLGPLRVDSRWLDAKRNRPQTRDALDAVGLTSAEVLRSWYTGGPGEMRRFVGPGPLLTDDRPMLEYYRSLTDGGDAVHLPALRGDAAQVIY